MSETWYEWMEDVSDTFNEYVFGPSPKEVLRRSAREVKRSMLQINREKSAYELREIALKNELRKRAQVATDARDLAPLAKDIARVRSGIRRTYKMASNLEGVHQRLMSASTTATIATALQDATMAMAAANGVNNATALASTMQNYAKQSARFEMASDMLEDAVDDDEEEAEDVSTLLGQLSEEMSLTLKFDLPAPAKARKQDEDDMADFQKRLQQLQRA